MRALREFTATLLLACLIAPLILHAAEPAQPFRDVNRMEKELQRGRSTKADAERLLGKPDGQGTAILPTESTPHEVWFYSDVAVTGMKGEPQGVLRANMRQQILLVFFRGETFEGFLWYTTEGGTRGVIE